VNELYYPSKNDLCTYASKPTLQNMTNSTSPTDPVNIYFKIYTLIYDKQYKFNRPYKAMNVVDIAYFKVLPHICLEGLQRTTENLECTCCLVANS